MVPWSALAATRSSSSTSEGMVAATAGSYTTFDAEVRPANSSPRATGPSLAATSASPTCHATHSRSDHTISRTRSMRSAMTPA